MKKILARIDTSIAYVENSLIVIILAVMVGMAFLQVVLRNVFSGGFLWGDVFLRHLVLWVGFLGASLATRRDKHISIDVFSRIAPKKYLPYIQMVVHYVTMGVALVLANAGYRFLIMEIENNTILFNEVPAWIFQIIIPVGFDLISLRFFLKILQQWVAFSAERIPIVTMSPAGFLFNGLWLLVHKKIAAGILMLGWIAAVAWGWCVQPPLVNFFLAITTILLAFGVSLQTPGALQAGSSQKETLKNGIGLILMLLMGSGIMIYRFSYVISGEF